MRKIGEFEAHRNYPNFYVANEMIVRKGVTGNKNLKSTVPGQV